jgi:ribosome-binding protein aMBF1 (putative translation factor)
MANKKPRVDTLGKDLRRAIQESGMAPTELAKKAGINHGVLSRFLRDERTITMPLASSLCKVLGLRLAKQD